MITITRIQFFLFLFTIQTGTVFITFQRPLIETAKSNAWIVLLFAGVLHYLQLIFYEKVYDRFNPGSFIFWLYRGYWF